MAETATYTLKVDWDNDGDFLDAGEDISADRISANIRRGFSSPLTRMAVVGRATFLLRNSAQSYSPPLEAGVLPSRAVQYSMTYDATEVVLFTGKVESIKPSFGQYRDRRCVLECVDDTALLDIHEGDIAMQTGVYAPDLIAAVVAAVYTPGGTDYQSGINFFPTSGDRWNWRAFDDAPRVRGPWESIRASSKILDCCAADWGRFFIAKDGDPTFHNRHHTALDTTTELTIDDLMTGMSYQKTSSTIHNAIDVTCTPRRIGQNLEVVGAISQDSGPRIEGSDSREFTLRFRDPVNSEITVGGKDCVTPVAGTDYKCTSDESGEGDDKTGDVTCSATFYGDRAEIELTNADTAPVYVQKLQVRAYPVRSQGEVTMSASDATSIAAYGKRKLAISAPLMNTQAEALALAEYLLDVYKDPVDCVEGLTFQANRNATLIAAARDLELQDRVIVSETQTGLSAVAGYIYSIQHTITAAGRDHRVTLNLQTGYDPGTPFRLDDSTLESGHVLIY